MSKIQSNGLSDSSAFNDEQFTRFVQYLNSYVQYDISQLLLGRLLTLIDASCDPSSKTDALKDLIRQECHSTYDNIWRQNCSLYKDYIITAKPQNEPPSFS